MPKRSFRQMFDTEFPKGTRKRSRVEMYQTLNQFLSYINARSVDSMEVAKAIRDGADSLTDSIKKSEVLQNVVSLGFSIKSSGSTDQVENFIRDSVSWVTLGSSESFLPDSNIVLFQKLKSDISLPPRAYKVKTGILLNAMGNLAMRQVELHFGDMVVCYRTEDGGENWVLVKHTSGHPESRVDSVEMMTLLKKCDYSRAVK